MKSTIILCFLLKSRFMRISNKKIRHGGMRGYEKSGAQPARADFSWLLFIVCNYARSTLPERRHLEHTWMWQGVPFTIAFTRWTLGFHVLFVSLWEWETLLPKVTPLPQISHFAIVGYTSLNHVEKHLWFYYSRCSRKKQVFFFFSCQK